MSLFSAAKDLVNSHTEATSFTTALYELRPLVAAIRASTGKMVIALGPDSTIAPAARAIDDEATAIVDDFHALEVRLNTLRQSMRDLEEGA